MSTIANMKASWRTGGLACLLVFICYIIYHEPRSPQSSSPLVDIAPVIDNFPQAQNRPPVPIWNRPPTPHVNERTPLFIGFSQNWLLLQQAVVSYITAGWPSSDIYVVDNSGTMFSNRKGQLTIENPSYLDYRRLEDTFNVNVLSTPTLLSFSQLQNFYLFEALRSNWTHYFWSHEDVVAFSDEGKSLYFRAVEDFRSSLDTASWATRLYAYDRLALVSVAALESIGGWDTSIPFYPADCDTYERMGMAGYRNPSPIIGQIFDVSTSVEDLMIFYEVGRPGSPSWMALNTTLSSMMAVKNRKDEERNTWQSRQQGGEGQPYYRDPRGVAGVRKQMIHIGRKMFKLKWGSSDCRLQARGIQSKDQWASRWW